MSKAGPFAGYVLGSLVLFGAGGCFIVTQEAKFGFGGDPDSTSATRRPIPVDAKGIDAVAIGVLVVGLGVLNLAQGIRSDRRIPVFWAGAVLFLVPVCYGLSKAALAVYRLVLEIRSPG